ncbi:MAG: DedA family protein [Planctomycetales bacterium]|nr:DedA family protein [Planctomycetales bacterium]
MGPHTLQQYMDWAQPYLDQYGYSAIFAGVLLEDFGLPLPGETLLIAGAFSASQGHLHIVPVLILAWCAAVMGDNVGYAMGRLAGRKFITRYGRFLGMTSHRLEVVSTSFRHYGGKIIVAARFFEIFRQLNGISAGLTCYPWWRFLRLNMIGAAIWVGWWGLLVYFLGPSISQALTQFKRAEMAILGAIVLAILVAAGYVHFRARRA